MSSSHDKHPHLEAAKHKQLHELEAKKAKDKQAKKELRAVHVPKGKPKGLLKRLRYELKAAVQRLGDRISKIRHAIAAGKKSPALRMFDDTTPSLIPRTAAAAAGYVNGLYATWSTIVSGPWRYKLSIAVSSGTKARCLDVEPGDATPADAPGWFKDGADDSQGKPWIYCSVSQADELVETMSAAHIHRSEYLLWTAHYTGSAHRCSASCYPTHQKADATQFTDRSHGLSLDESSVRAGAFSE